MVAAFDALQGGVVRDRGVVNEGDRLQRLILRAVEAFAGAACLAAHGVRGESLDVEIGAGSRGEPKLALLGLVPQQIEVAEAWRARARDW